MGINKDYHSQLFCEQHLIADNISHNKVTIPQQRGETTVIVWLFDLICKKVVINIKVVKTNHTHT